MAKHVCGAVLPNAVGPYVEHLAACPETHPDHADFCKAIVSLIAYDAARDRGVPPTVSRDKSGTVTRHRRDTGETRDVSRDTSRFSPSVSRDSDETVRVPSGMSTRQMADMRDSGASLRAIAAVSGVSPETVRRRLARHAAEVTE